MEGSSGIKVKRELGVDEPVRSRQSPNKNKSSPSKSKTPPQDDKGAQQEIEDSVNRCRVNELGLEHTSYVQYPGNHWNKEEDFKADQFKETFQTKIHRYERGRELEIDLVGLAPAIANAYRRIMIAEVPTMAIEHCFVYQNTSVIQDEMLAHRLGMIPIKADPGEFDYKPADLAPDAASGNHTAVFELRAKCEKLKVDPDTTGRRQDLYSNYKVYSRQLRWKPVQNQSKKFTGKNAIKPLHRRILIAKLADKQEIHVRVHANKGIGRDHAKFSPVATATYRLMPDIQILDKITGEEAKRLQESFSRGVIGLKGTNNEAYVIDSRLDSGSRNFFRHASLKDKVRYDLIKDHFIFSIESAGAIPAIDILLQSCDILDSKCDLFLNELEISRQGMDQSSSMVESI